jgi:hypothetical protein
VSTTTIASTRSATGVPTGRLAVWWVLVSEIVIFGGVLVSYIMHRLGHPEWATAAAHTNTWAGAFNTLILLSSSLSAVLAHQAAEAGNGRRAAGLLRLTALGGLAFLTVKSFEWAHEIHDKGTGYGHSDELGKFDLGGLPPGEYELVSTRKRDHQDTPKHGVIARAGDRRVSLVVPDAGTIIGRIVLDGAPVDYFGVIISDDPEGVTYGSPNAVRALDGTFAEPDLRPGALALVVVGPSFMKKVIKHVTITEGQTTDLGDIVVDRGRSVTGRVTDGRGHPVASALVAVSRGGSIEEETTLRPLVGDTRTARTDANGAYRLDGLPADGKDLTIAASAEQGIATPRDLPLDATTIDLVIAHTGAIDGVVTELKGRSSVTARSNEGLSVYATVDTSGEFHLDRLPAIASPSQEIKARFCVGAPHHNCVSIFDSSFHRVPDHLPHPPRDIPNINTCAHFQEPDRKPPSESWRHILNHDDQHRRWPPC